MELETVYIRVGTTRSGKIIPYSSCEDTLGIITHFLKSTFTSDDMLDALALFNFLALRCVRRAEINEIFDRYAETIQNFIEPLELERVKVRANISSAFDLRDLGKSLAAIEFVNF
ncbi:MAG: hypothetical protein NT027_07890 [Proteobacteria bacterium]|nr:hypothetical protein [Pseudomonadota bacterium]